MPHVSGRDTLRRLREVDTEVAVIYVSGYSSKMADVANDAVLDFIAKPFQPAELVSTIVKALDRFVPKRVE